MSEVRAAVGGFPRPTQPTRPRPKAAAGSALASGEALVEWLSRGRMVDSADVGKRTSRAHTFG
ncbi:MAG: hypothetical protein H9535_03590 [Ignavibacteria bacterium]|nr:hypothetical protein [Ignavibacteria bacterium]